MAKHVTHGRREPESPMWKRWFGIPNRSSRAWGIAKTMEMLNSPHLAGMSSDAKRGALLMALEAAGTSVESLIQDAVYQQRLLDQQEEAREAKLQRLEAAKLEENRRVQADLDRLTAKHLHRLQANLDAIARHEDAFRAWQKEKEQEAQRMTDAAAFCVPHARVPHTANLSVVVEPVRAARA
ncbi:MAG: hypothetical protein ACLQKA_16995 [Bryobacteraceae bacterium]